MTLLELERGASVSLYSHMKLRAGFFLFSVAAILTVLLGTAGVRANDVELSTLTFEAEALKQEFNASGSLSRMVMILSPT